LQLNLFEKRDLHALLFGDPSNNEYDSTTQLALL